MYPIVKSLFNIKSLTVVNKKNQVSVEPDSTVWKALEDNKNRNNCKFHIIKGFISKKKLSLTKQKNVFEKNKRKCSCDYLKRKCSCDYLKRRCKKVLLRLYEYFIGYRISDGGRGYGRESIIDNNSKIKSFTLDEIKKKYDLNFNVLIADCEGFLEQFFDENTNLFNNLRLIIFEADKCHRCNYAKIKDYLIKKKFKCELEGIDNVWIKK